MKSKTTAAKLTTTSGVLTGSLDTKGCSGSLKTIVSENDDHDNEDHYDGALETEDMLIDGLLAPPAAAKKKPKSTHHAAKDKISKVID